jgi:hypothetical protein
MSTGTGVTAQVTIFDPIISFNGDATFTSGTDIGFIGDKVTFTYKQKVAKYESGIPKSLRKALKVEEEAMIKFDLMQATLGNFQSAMNRPSSAVSSSVLKVGGDSSVQVLTYVRIVGTDDSGNLLTITFYKCIVEDNGDYNIDTDFMKIPITLTAVADLTRARGDQLFRIER